MERRERTEGNVGPCLTECNICPRECRVNRLAGQVGVCGAAGEDVLVARAALHMWEEPCISGENGSGAVFFCGCPLHCVYCQNDSISGAKAGKLISVRRLAEIFLELQEQKAANVNLVTPTHYTPQIVQAVQFAREQGLTIPIVYNCGGYEKVDTLKMLEGIVDVYLTDFKYMETEPAAKYSRAADYPQVAGEALAEMVRQVKAASCGAGMERRAEAAFDEDGMMQKGVIVRHLLLPGHLSNAKKVVRHVYRTYGDQVYLSLMNQYTPRRTLTDPENLLDESMSGKRSAPDAGCPEEDAGNARFGSEGWPELNRRVTKREYERLVEYAISLGVENGFIQEGETAGESFIPAFDNEGV